MRAPLPDIPLIPTGGVDVEAAGAWLDAGAVALGLGSPLIGDALDPGGDLDALAERARAVTAAVERAEMSDGDGGLVTLGETLGLLVADDVGPLSLARGMRLSMGGAESNVAIGASRLGVPATWIGRLGNDPIGDLIERQLLAERVRCLVQRDPSPTAIMLRERRTGTSARVSYYRHGSAGSHLRPADIPDGVVEKAGVLHLSGITPALGAEPAAAVREAVRRARQAGVLVSVDLNFRSRLWDAGTAGSGVPGAGGRCGHPLRGRRRGPYRAREGRLGAAPEALADALAALGPSEVVVKLGPPRRDGPDRRGADRGARRAGARRRHRGCGRRLRRRLPRVPPASAAGSASGCPPPPSPARSRSPCPVTGRRSRGPTN